MREAVLAGLAIGLLPSFFIGDDLNYHDLKILILDAEPLPLQLWALHVRRRESRPVVDALIAWLAVEIGDPPFWEQPLPAP